MVTRGEGGRRVGKCVSDGKGEGKTCAWDGEVEIFTLYGEEERKK